MIEFRLEGFPHLFSSWNTIFVSDRDDDLEMVIIGLLVDYREDDSEQCPDPNNEQGGLPELCFPRRRGFLCGCERQRHSSRLKTNSDHTTLGQHWDGAIKDVPRFLPPGAGEGQDGGRR